MSQQESSLLETLIPFISQYRTYIGSTDVNLAFTPEGTNKVRAVGLEPDKLICHVSDPVSTTEVNGVMCVTKCDSCSCLSAALGTAVMYKDCTNMTHAEAVTASLGITDWSMSPGGVVEVPDKFFQKISESNNARGTGGMSRTQKDNEGHKQKIASLLTDNNIEFSHGAAIPKEFNNDNASYEHGAIAIVVSVSQSVAHPESATCTYGLVFAPGRTPIISILRRGHCRSIVAIDEQRAKIYVDTVREVLKGGKKVRFINFLHHPIVN